MAIKITSADEVPAGKIRSEGPGSPVDYKTIFRLGFYFLKEVRGSALFYMALYLLFQGIMLGTTQEVAHLISVIRDSQAFSQKSLALASADIGSLLVIYGVWLVLVLMGTVVSILLKLATVKMDVRMANKIRQHLFQKLMRQDPEFFHQNEPGRLTMTLNQLSAEAQMTMRQLILDPVLQFLTLCATAALLVYNFAALSTHGLHFDLFLGESLLAVTVFAFLSPWFTSRLGKKLQSASYQLQEQNLNLAALIQGALGSPEEIQALQAEEIFAQKHRAGLRALLEARLRQTNMIEVVNSLNALPSIIVQAALLGLAIFLIVHDPRHANVGAVIAVYMLAPQFIAPIHGFANFMVMARSAWPTMQRIISFLELKNRVLELPDAVEVGKIEPTLEVRDIIFRYQPSTQPLFRGLSFEAAPGKITGIIGKMGQGKTTLFRLALRFYDPEAGEILMGGKPIREFTLNSLRQHAVMLSQFPAFFHDTVRENLRLARADSSDAEIQEVCERTGLWSILQDKFGQQPLDQPFSAGLKLSGGERKLLALSRCLLRNPTFLFLDEPTVGMDPHEKLLLIPSLRQGCVGKTVLAIDHDIIWLLKFCDAFVIFNEGRVIQAGSAEKLLNEEGLFKSLYFEAQPADTSIRVAKRFTINEKKGKLYSSSENK